MAIHAHGDFETRSAVELKKTGSHKYARDPSTSPWCFAWAIGEAEVEVWTPENPGRIFELFVFLADGGTFVAHNAAFELDIWNELMRPRFGWPALAVEQTRCTMAQALALSLPPGLAQLARVVGAPARKDEDGAKNMMRMAKPRKIWTPDKLAKRSAKVAAEMDLGDSQRFTILADGRVVEWWAEPHRLALQYAYCAQDVRAEREVERRLIPLSEAEQRLWILDRKINNRGFMIDRKLIAACLEVVAEEQNRLDYEMGRATAGAVSTPRQVKELVAWIESRGVSCPGLAKADVLALLDDPFVPSDVHRALEVRQEASRSSTAKLTAALAAADADDRVRGTMQFHGANTGRWAGRRLQPHNLPRTGMDQSEIDAAIAFLVERADGVPEWALEEANADE